MEHFVGFRPRRFVRSSMRLTIIFSSLTSRCVSVAIFFDLGVVRGGYCRALIDLRLGALRGGFASLRGGFAFLRGGFNLLHIGSEIFDFFRLRFDAVDFAVNIDSELLCVLGKGSAERGNFFFQFCREFILSHFGFTSIGDEGEEFFDMEIGVAKMFRVMELAKSSDKRRG